MGMDWSLREGNVLHFNLFYNIPHTVEPLYVNSRRRSGHDYYAFE